jgi:ATP-dependent RNA helicase SUPV3L1/SUV3
MAMNISLTAPTRPLHMLDRARGVTALLGPTNTGKTHYAIERMLAHSSGIIGLPLRLLAREVYNRAVDRVGVDQVALITGEEKIKPKNPRYWVSTVEAMPRDLDVAFVAIDEIQLAGDLDRGHVFTDRLLNRRGRDETLVIGAMTMRRAVEQLLPGVTVVSRPRLSKLSFAGERKLSRLPPRCAIVAFSAEEVYTIAELVRRQRGGAAVVLGALSPRTRNAQVALYQQGEVDYVIATDAIGMGLNLDVDHVAFAADRKFDGWQFRRLNAAEFGQIAGRAGRHLRDGTFGTSGRCPPFDEDLVAQLEDHRFDPVGHLQWRNSDLNFASIETLQASLDQLPQEPGLTRAPLAEDVLILDIAAHDEEVRGRARSRGDVQRLWDACQIPDYRKVSPGAHAELVLSIYRFIGGGGRIPDDWFKRQLALFDRTDGDIDTLSARIAQVRTCTYIANRPDWLADPEHWQGVARQVEDNLSDALHERLAHRFVDRRTSVLMRRLRENAMLEAEITAAGDVNVEGQHVGRLEGFRFTPDPQAAGEAAKALNAAAQKALAGEIETRANRFREAVDEAFVLANDGIVRWLGEAVGKIAAGDKILAPRLRVLADEQLSGASLEQVQRRLDLWLAQHLKKLLGPLSELEAGEGLDGMARGIAFQVAESLGVLERSRVADEVKNLDQAARASLRRLGLRFGAFHIYLPQLLKPAPRAVAAQLWALKNGGIEQTKGLDELPHLAASGRTSFPANKAVPRGLYRAAGFRVCAERAVRIDILERLADLIRPAINYRPGLTPGEPPPGAADGDGFVTTVAMTSLAGCSGEDFASILRSLGYVAARRAGPAITVKLVPLAATVPVTPGISASEPAVASEPAGVNAPATMEGATVASAASAAEPPAVIEGAASNPQEAHAAALTTLGGPAPMAGDMDETAGREPAQAAAPAIIAEPVVAEATAEIEVWRVHRHHQAGNRRPRGDRPRRPARPLQPETIVAPAPALADRPLAVTASGSSSRPEESRPAGRPRPRPDRRSGPGADRDKATERPDRKFGGPPRGEPRKPDRFFATTANREARERPIDPDSPFAKLLALKAALENKPKKD